MENFVWIGLVVLVLAALVAADMYRRWKVRSAKSAKKAASQAKRSASQKAAYERRKAKLNGSGAGVEQ